MKKQPIQEENNIVEEHSEETKELGGEWKEKYLRALADYHNLEKRTAEIIAQTRMYAAERVLQRLLPVADTLEKAQVHLQDQGLGLAVKQFISVLEEEGVEKIEAVGKQFDPHEMECVEVVKGNDNEVIAEVAPGYRFHGKVLRVAQVTVGRNSS